MKRILILLALIACTSTKKLQLDEAHSEHDQLAGNVSMRVDSAERAKLDQRDLVTTGPGERVEETFSADGGVATRTITRWGGSTAARWTHSATDAEQHLELDAGVQAVHGARDELHEHRESDVHPAASCTFGGYLWALAVIGIAIVTLKLLARKS